MKIKRFTAFVIAVAMFVFMLPMVAAAAGPVVTIAVQKVTQNPDKTCTVDFTAISTEELTSVTCTVDGGATGVAVLIIGTGNTAGTLAAGVPQAGQAILNFSGAEATITITGTPAGGGNVTGATRISAPTPEITPTASPSPFPTFTPPTTADTPESLVNLESNLPVPSGNPGDVINVTVPLSLNMFNDWNASLVTVSPVLSTNVEEWPFVIENITYSRSLNMSYGGTVNALFNLAVSPKAKAGTKAIKFNVSYTAYFFGESKEVTKTVSTYVNVLSDGISSGEDSQNSALVIRTDSDVAAPKGKAGGAVTLNLPIENKSDLLTDVVIAPDISADLNAFPFVVDQLDYSTRLGEMEAGAKTTLKYKFTLAEKVTEGTKPVSFTATYKLNGVTGTSKFTVYVNVTEGYVPPESEGATSTPKLIIKQYSITPSKVYAGETFDLELVFENTSSQSNVQNVKVSISNGDMVTSGAYILPAENGSNTIYIDKVGKGESITKTVRLQVRPDTPAKPQMINLTLDYENEDLKPFTSQESITVPVSQRIRIVIDEPTLDNTMPSVGMSAYCYFSIVNMGKASVYNLMVNVEGTGVSMEESYYGGTLTAGSQARVETNLFFNEPGDIPVSVLISYEDEYGEQFTETKQVAVSVTSFEEPVFDPSFNPEAVPPEQSGLPVWVIILLAVVVLAAIIVLVIILKKRAAAKRARELEDE